MDNITIIQHLVDEREIARKDADMASSPEDSTYYLGKVDAMTETLSLFNEEN